MKSANVSTVDEERLKLPISIPSQRIWYDNNIYSKKYFHAYFKERKIVINIVKNLQNNLMALTKNL